MGFYLINENGRKSARPQRFSFQYAGRDGLLRSRGVEGESFAGRGGLLRSRGVEGESFAGRGGLLRSGCVNPLNNGETRPYGIALSGVVFEGELCRPGRVVMIH
jgi:hypothetical protein